MAHVFPRKLDSNDQPIDADSINENLQTVIREVSGRLNEHNCRGHLTDVSERFIPTRKEVSSDAIVNIYRNGWEVEVTTLGTGGGTVFTNPGLNDGSTGADGGYKVSTSGDWVKVDNMDATIQTSNSILWVMASLQQICVRQDQLLSSTASHDDADKLGGIQYAIAIDGSILFDSVLGGADRVNDPYGQAWNTFNHPFAVDTIIPVTPGTHEIALYARFVVNKNFDNADWGVDTTSDTYIVICNRELIVVEMK